MARLTVNGQAHNVDVDPNTPLLWVLREQIGLTGTKYGCGIAQCGACTVHIDGMGAMRSCSLPISAAEGKQITTIEGLAQNGVLHKVQKAWIEHDVPQCGYCQSGMIMAVAAAAQGQAEADRRRHRRQPSPISAVAAPSSRCARRSTPPRRAREREATMNYVPKMNRRSFVVTAAAAGGGLALGLELPFGGPQPILRAGRLARDQRLGGDPPGRHGRDPRRALRDGPGLAHRPGAAGRRGARLRLVEGDLGKSDARAECRPQARVGRLRDRRQPRHPPVARLRAQGRRHRARDADRRPPPTSGRCRRPSAAPRPA